MQVALPAPWREIVEEARAFLQLQHSAQHHPQDPTLADRLCHAAMRLVQSLHTALDPPAGPVHTPPAAAAAASAALSSLATRQHLLGCLMPAMHALYSIDQDDLVQAAISLFNSATPRTLCPALDKLQAGAAGQQGSALAPTDARLEQIVQAAAALVLPSTSNPSTSDPDPSTAWSSIVSLLLRPQLRALVASRSLLHLLLPLAAAFHECTGLQPLASDACLPELYPHMNPCFLGYFSSASGRPGAAQPGQVGSALVGLAAVTAQLVVCAGAGGSEDERTEARELCACIQLLWGGDCTAWLQAWMEAKEEAAQRQQEEQQGQDADQGDVTAASDLAELPPGPCEVLCCAWIAALQDPKMDQFAWDKEHCALVCQALESSCRAAEGPEPLLGLYIQGTLETLLTEASVPGFEELLSAGPGDTAPGGQADAADVACRLARVLGHFTDIHATVLAMLDQRGQSTGADGKAGEGGKKPGESGKKASAAAARKQGAEPVIRLLRAMYRGNLPGLMAACCKLLAPESNSALEVRLLAVTAMDAELGSELESPRDEKEEEALHAALWSPPTLQALLFCLMHDPAVRVRRALMQLLPHVALPVGSPWALSLARVLIAKTWDKDGVVQERAAGMAVQLPLSVLAACCSRHQWTHIVRDGVCRLAGVSLGAVEAGAGAGAGSAAATASDLQAAGEEFSASFSRFLKRVLVKAMGPKPPPMPVVPAAAGEEAESSAGAVVELGDLGQCVGHPAQLMAACCLGLPRHVIHKASVRLELMRVK